jgi:secreted trypsin-like serine protease
LTAAHCLQGISVSQLAVVVRLHSINDLTWDKIYLASKIAIHENWDPIWIQNDVAVIKLAKPVPFSRTVSPICLPTSSLSTVVYNRNLVATGWGTTQTGSLSPVLQQGVLRVINGNSFCTQNGRFYNILNNYCAIDADNKTPFTNICFGDSGGPLLLWDGLKATVYGITSYVYQSRGVCINSVPSYYASVPTYLQWIRNKMSTL